MITRDTVFKLAKCFRELEAGEKLVREARKEMKNFPQSSFDDVKREYRFEMSIPSGDQSHRLLDVKPELGLSVIEAHLAEQRRRLVELNEIARIEIATPES